MQIDEGRIIIENLEKLYRDVFTTKEMKNFIRLVWIDYKDIKDITDLSFRVIMKKLIVYGVATGGKKTYSHINMIVNNDNVDFKLNSYGNFNSYYKKYVKKLKKFLKKNPNRKKEIFMTKQKDHFI